MQVEISHMPLDKLNVFLYLHRCTWVCRSLLFHLKQTPLINTCSSSQSAWSGRKRQCSTSRWRPERSSRWCTPRYSRMTSLALCCSRLVLLRLTCAFLVILLFICNGWGMVAMETCNVTHIRKDWFMLDTYRNGSGKIENRAEASFYKHISFM